MGGDREWGDHPDTAHRGTHDLRLLFELVLLTDIVFLLVYVK